MPRLCMPGAQVDEAVMSVNSHCVRMQQSADEPEHDEGDRRSPTLNLSSSVTCDATPMRHFRLCGGACIAHLWRRFIFR